MKRIDWRYVEITGEDSTKVFVVIDEAKAAGSRGLGSGWRLSSIRAVCPSLRDALAWAEDYVARRLAAEKWKLHHYAAERPYWTSRVAGRGVYVETHEVVTAAQPRKASRKARRRP